MKNNKKLSNEQIEKIRNRLIKNLEESTFRFIKKEIRYKLMKKQKWKCNICNKKILFSNKSNWKGEIGEIDHIHPFSKKSYYCNGTWNINEEENLQALCRTCNRKKSDKIKNEK